MVPLFRFERRFSADQGSPPIALDQALVLQARTMRSGPLPARHPYAASFAFPGIRPSGNSPERILSRSRFAMEQVLVGRIIRLGPSLVLYLPGLL